MAAKNDVPRTMATCSCLQSTERESKNNNSYGETRRNKGGIAFGL